MRKYTKSEGHSVLTPQQHQAAEDELRRLGKTSARDLTDEQRESFRVSLDKAEEL
jgi:hypothetical protein